MNTQAKMETTSSNNNILQHLPSLLKDTFAAWNEDKAPRLGAALSYYTVFSLAPFLIVILAVSGIVFDQVGGDAKAKILEQIYATFGNAGGQLVETMVNNANQRGSGIIATIVGLATLLLGAGGLFGQLQDSLNTIWGVAPKPNLGFMEVIRVRFLSFTMVLGTAFLLLVSLAASAAIQALSHYMTGVLPLPGFVLESLNLLIGFVVITLLFAMIYKVLPDVEIQWRDVWIGAAVTSFLFSLGKWGLGVYLARSAPGSAYGEAGSLVLILLWVYYAAQILFFGAEFTQVYATRFGSHIAPSSHAIALTDEALARQGMPRTSAIAAAVADESKTTGEILTDADEAGPNPSGRRPLKSAPPQAEQPDWGFLGAALAGFVAVLGLYGARQRRKEAQIARKISRIEEARRA